MTTVACGYTPATTGDQAAPARLAIPTRAPVVQALGFCRAGERPYGAAVWWRHCGLIAVHQALLWAYPAPGGARRCPGVRDPAPAPARRAGIGVLVPGHVLGPAHGDPAMPVAPGARAPRRALSVPLCCYHCFTLLCFHTNYFVPTPCDRLHVASNHPDDAIRLA